MAQAALSGICHRMVHTLRRENRGEKLLGSPERLNRTGPAQKGPATRKRNAVVYSEAPVIALTGPAGVDSMAATEGLCALVTEAGQGKTDHRQTVVDLAFLESGPEFCLSDHLTTSGRPGTVVLVKNVHELHPDALPGFEFTLRRLVAGGARCVCTVSLPMPPETRTAFGAVFDRLHRDRLVRPVNLRPLPRGRMGTFVTEVLGAVPEPALVTWLWELTWGWPGAIVSALKIHRDNGMMRVVDQHAYLTGHCAPALPTDHESVLALRRLGDTVWHTAKALVVLGPLGDAAPRLIAEALDLPEPEILAALTTLERTGMLRHRPTEGRWRFRTPLVAGTLKPLLGPFERRHLAVIAVSAIWSGQARATDAFHLPDQLVDAGRMTDSERARRELLACAERAAATDGDRTISWLRAAAELTADQAERAAILLTHAETCLLRGKAELCLESSGILLSDCGDDLPDGRLVPTLFLHLTALHEAGDVETLERIARGDEWPWPGTPLEQAVARAFTLSLVGRWRETHDLLEDIQRDDGAAEVAGYLRFIKPITDLWLGIPDDFDRDVATLPARVAAGAKPLGELTCHAGALVALGEFDRAERLIADTRQVAPKLGAPAQVIRAIYRGEIDEALEQARKHIAISAPNGCDAYQTVMFHLAATVQLLRGKLARSRDLVATARSRRPTLPHLLALPEAWYEVVFQEPGRARPILLTALSLADEHGVVAYTDALWATLAAVDWRLGRPDRLPEYLHRVEKIAGQLGTESAELHRLKLAALLHDDRHTADEALALTRRRGQPLDHAITIESLVRYGLADPALLPEAYALLGDLDALLARAWMRALMRKHDVTVPSRAATVAENERLLAVLMTEGLGNKQIAKALLTSEKSVEGRLSRLFTRTGYKSRVELAAAMLTGQFTT